MKVNLAPLKSKALNFPEPVRSLILSEPDSLEVKAFLDKIGVFERLLKLEVETK